MKDAYQLNLLSIALVIRHNLILPTTPTSVGSILLLFFLDPEEIKKASPVEYVISLNMYSPDQLSLIEHNFILGEIAEKAYSFISEELWWAHAVSECLLYIAGVCLTCKWTCVVQLVNIITPICG